MYCIELDGGKLPLNNIFCIGRNYVEHITELNNNIGDEPLVFMKPTQSVLYENQAIIIPSFTQNVHYECEIVVYIGRDANNIEANAALNYIAGIGIGLDLTARDVQDTAKNKGCPWLKAKGFKGAACISKFLQLKQFTQIDNVEFSLSINNQIVQSGNSKNMIYPIAAQIAYLSQIYSLKSGDIIYTGTPKGVGKLNHGDKLNLNLANKISANWLVA